jgi:hypothetical protein
VQTAVKFVLAKVMLYCYTLFMKCQPANMDVPIPGKLPKNSSSCYFLQDTTPVKAGAVANTQANMVKVEVKYDFEVSASDLHSIKQKVD